MSDGAITQYKNKNNLINLSHHEEDFNIAAEWHFHATSHGKGACDGVGGTFKRGAYRYSLTRDQFKHHNSYTNGLNHGNQQCILNMQRKQSMMKSNYTCKISLPKRNYYKGNLQLSLFYT